jgi:hypothetical protein
MARSSRDSWCGSLRNERYGDPAAGQRPVCGRYAAGMRPGDRQLRRTALRVQGSACRATAQCGTKSVGFLLLTQALRRRRFRGTRRNRAGRQHASRYCGTRNRIAERATESVGQKRPKYLIIGSPTRARTWDLRINRLSQSFGFSDTYVKIRSAITANLRSVKALLPWFRSDLRNRIQGRLDNRNDHAQGLWRFHFQPTGSWLTCWT